MAIQTPFAVFDTHDNKRIASFIDHPVKSTANVTEYYIDGFGGNLSAQYFYIVDTKTYKGDGNIDVDVPKNSSNW